MMTTVACWAWQVNSRYFWGVHTTNIIAIEVFGSFGSTWLVSANVDKVSWASTPSVNQASPSAPPENQELNTSQADLDQTRHHLASYMTPSSET